MTHEFTTINRRCKHCGLPEHVFKQWSGEVECVGQNIYSFSAFKLEKQKEEFAEELLRRLARLTED